MKRGEAQFNVEDFALVNNFLDLLDIFCSQLRSRREKDFSRVMLC